MGPSRFVFLFLLSLSLVIVPAKLAVAEEQVSEESEMEPTPPEATPEPLTSKKRGITPTPEEKKRKYYIEDTKRIDAGVFHVGFAVGGNFYTEPELQTVGGVKTYTGNYLKDFGFQAGAYFDYDYSELAEDIPLMLRGMIGYKYILNSVHVFTFDGMVRHQFRMSDKATFGVGIGGSAALWYRVYSASPPYATEEILFLPSFVVGAGFEFNPFMVDFKWLINRWGQDSTITGVELYFGFRL